MQACFVNINSFRRLGRNTNGRAMIEIFYKDNGQMKVSQSEADFAIIPYDDVIWIDLLNPSTISFTCSPVSKMQSNVILLTDLIVPLPCLIIVLTPF